jgi:hypothetical protein
VAELEQWFALSDLEPETLIPCLERAGWPDPVRPGSGKRSRGRSRAGPGISNRLTDQRGNVDDYPHSLAAATQLIASRLDREGPGAIELTSLCAFLALGCSGLLEVILAVWVGSVRISLSVMRVLTGCGRSGWPGS